MVGRTLRRLTRTPFCVGETLPTLAQTLANFSCKSLIWGVSFRSYLTAKVRKKKTL
jgi:hypothetical protein